jgi:hypothetical protein
VKKTIISHFYNEEYLLPWWLKHHKKYFDHGIMIDYHSTDNSREIIREICPKWDIITSRNPNFEAKSVDIEVMDIESWIKDWKIVLNTTEFLVSTEKDWFNNKVFEEHEQIKIPCHAMVDVEPNNQSLDYNVPLHKQKDKGINVHVKPKFFSVRFARSMHKFKVEYSWGRHFSSYNTQPEFVKKFDDTTTSTIFNILWYGFSPYNEKLLKRKLQIQKVAPRNGFGVQHFTTQEKLNDKYNELLIESGEISFLNNQKIFSF